MPQASRRSGDDAECARSTPTRTSPTDMATWFTADTHFGHAKVLSGRHARPFASVTEMDNALVE